MCSATFAPSRSRSTASSGSGAAGAVDREQRQRAGRASRTAVASSAGDRALAVDLVGRRVRLDPQHRPAPEARGVHEREVARLPPGRAAVERAHRRDDVDELREAADPHAVGVAQERDQQAADDERVGDRVVVLGQRRRVLERAGDVRVVRVGLLVPDVPLVDAEAEPLAAALAPGHGVGGRDDGADHAVEVERAGEVGVEVRVVGGVVVGVQRDVVGDVPRQVEHRVLPAAEGGHPRVRAADDAELDRGVDQAHRLARLGREPPVLDRGLLPDLPRPVHLVAQAPQLHAVRLGVPVGHAPVGVAAAGRRVAVLDEVAGGVDAARAEVDREHRLRARLARPAHELVGADLVGLDRAPGEVEAGRAGRARGPTPSSQS